MQTKSGEDNGKNKNGYCMTGNVNWSVLTVFEHLNTQNNHGRHVTMATTKKKF